MKRERQIYNALMRAVKEGCVPFGYYGPETCRWATPDEMRRFGLEDCPMVHLDKSGEMLPTTLAADESSGGASVKMTFERVIVWPDGRREIDGVTPKSLPAPDASHALPRPTDPTDCTNEGAA